MKRTMILSAVLPLSALVAAPSVVPPSEGARLAEKQEVIFSASPKRLHARATDAPLLGNGDLAVCLTGAPEKQVLWVTKNDFWFLKHGSALPLNFGTLNLTAPALSGAPYSGRQSLRDATTHLVFQGKDSTLEQTVFVAATANVLVVRLVVEGKPLEFDVEFAPTRYRPDEEQRTWDVDGGAVHLVSRSISNNVDVATVGQVAWKSSAGTSKKFTVMPRKPVTLLLAMATDFDGGSSEARARKLLKDSNPVALAKAHATWWDGYWGKSFVEIPDADIMRRYCLSEYILGSASRNAKFPPAIIGPWATTQQGWCGYWMNYNHAAPFYGLYVSNRIEQADPQDTPILDFLPRGESNAKAVFDGKLRGALYPVGIGPFGLDATGGLHQDPLTNRQYDKGIMTWGQRSNTAYNLVNMSRRWYATYDPDYGRKILPYAKAVTDFWEDYLVKEDDGKGGYRYSVIGDSVQEGTGANRNPSVTLGLVRNAFKLMLDLSRELGVDADRRAKREDILANLAPYPTVEIGPGKKRVFVLAEDMPRFWGDNTVHIQHIYPAGGIGLDSPPELLAIARDTISVAPRWHDGNGSNSFFPAAVRIGYDAEVILRELHRYSTEVMEANGFSKGNVHGIENCSTVPNTVNEMLLQSHEGVVRLFPNWPKKFDARFGTLRTAGAFLVSAELKGGEISHVKITSEKGRDCTIINPWPGRTVRVIRNGKLAETVDGERFALKTTMAETLGLQTN